MVRANRSLRELRRSRELVHSRLSLTASPSDVQPIAVPACELAFELDYTSSSILASSRDGKPSSTGASEGRSSGLQPPPSHSRRPKKGATWPPPQPMPLTEDEAAASGDLGRQI